MTDEHARVLGEGDDRARAEQDVFGPSFLLRRPLLERHGGLLDAQATGGQLAGQMTVEDVLGHVLVRTDDVIVRVDRRHVGGEADGERLRRGERRRVK